MSLPTQIILWLQHLLSLAAHCLLALTVHAWMLLMSFNISSSWSNSPFSYKKGSSYNPISLVPLPSPLFLTDLTATVIPLHSSTISRGHMYICVEQGRFGTKKLKPCWQTKCSLRHKHFLAPILSSWWNVKESIEVIFLLSHLYKKQFEWDKAHIS